MADSTEKQNVLMWFRYLHALQDACSFNTSVNLMDILTFANSTILSVATNPNQQEEFRLKARSKPGFDISPDDLTKYSTFEALLDHFNPLTTYIAAYIQTFATPYFSSGSLTDFLSAVVTAAFPGGAQGDTWTTSDRMLQSVMPSICFSAKLQTAVGQTVGDATKKVCDVVKQIATLG